MKPMEEEREPYTQPLLTRHEPLRALAGKSGEKDPISDKDPGEKDPTGDKQVEKDPIADKDPNEKAPGSDGL
jgi:hypothetical protein